MQAIKTLKFAKYSPFMNRVLIKRFEPVTKSKGGVLLPESKAHETNYGTVVAAGPGYTFPNGVKRDNAVK